MGVSRPPDGTVNVPALELRGIRKQFGSVQALRGADFTLMPGELHALLGENGAGKTTLTHVAYGLVRPEAGEIRVRGTVTAIPSPRAARRLAIGMVHQHFTSVPALSVSENIALTAGWPVAPANLHARVRAVSERIGLPLDPDALAGSLSVGLKQRLEIVKALATDTRILLLDEPTAVLAPAESEDLLRVVRSFTAGGGSAVLITHKLDEALAAADTVTVLRQGAVAFTGPVRGQTAATLAAAMIGPGSATAPPTRVATTRGSEARTGPAPVRLESVDIARESGLGIAVRQVSLMVPAGEIVGVAAVEGNGQRELLRAVAGRAHVLRGKIEVMGPVGFIPEDRTTEGLIPELSLVENVVLGAGEGGAMDSTRSDRLACRARIHEGSAHRIRSRGIGTRRTGGEPKRREPAEGRRRTRACAGATRRRGRRSDSRPRYPSYRGHSQSASVGRGGGRGGSRSFE